MIIRRVFKNKANNQHLIHLTLKNIEESGLKDGDYVKIEKVEE